MKTNPNARKKTARDLRAPLRAHGYTVAGWARANGYNRISASLALSGQMNGPLGREIRSKVEVLKG